MFSKNSTTSLNCETKSLSPKKSNACFEKPESSLNTSGRSKAGFRRVPENKVTKNYSSKVNITNDTVDNATYMIIMFTRDWEKMFSIPYSFLLVMERIEF